MDEFETIAAAMLRLYGRGAATVAEEYAARYRELGDEAETRKWLEIGQIARARDREGWAGEC